MTCRNRYSRWITIKDCRLKWSETGWMWLMHVWTFKFDVWSVFVASRINIWTFPLKARRRFRPLSYADEWRYRCVTCLWGVHSVDRLQRRNGPIRQDERYHLFCQKVGCVPGVRGWLSMHFTNLCQHTYPPRSKVTLHHPSAQSPRV